MELRPPLGTPPGRSSGEQLTGAARPAVIVALASLPSQITAALCHLARAAVYLLRGGLSAPRPPCSAALKGAAILTPQRAAQWAEGPAPPRPQLLSHMILCLFTPPVHGLGEGHPGQARLPHQIRLPSNSRWSPCARRQERRLAAARPRGPAWTACRGCRTRSARRRCTGMLPFLCIPPRAEPKNAYLAGFDELVH